MAYSPPPSPLVEDTQNTGGEPGLFLLSVIRGSDTSEVSSDGDYCPIGADEQGRTKVSTKPGSVAITTGSITASGQTVWAEASYLSNINLRVQSSSLVGHVAAFEGSLDSTNGVDGSWFSIQAIRSDSNIMETSSGTLSSTPNYAWEISSNGLTYIRVRATSHTSGTALWAFGGAPHATEPIPGCQVSGTQPISGTLSLTLSGVAAHSSATSGNPVFIGGAVNTVVDTSLVSGDRVRLPIASSRQVVTHMWAPPEQVVGYSTALSAPIIVSSAVEIFAAQVTTGLKYHITYLSILNTHATQAGEVSILGGAADPQWTMWVPANMKKPIQVKFKIPLLGSDLTAITLEPSAAMNLFVAIRGYIGRVA